ncbi:hypothetical protein ACQKWADRAFT_283849 [Trichoderma austrokoningii]
MERLEYLEDDEYGILFPHPTMTSVLPSRPHPINRSSSSPVVPRTPMVKLQFINTAHPGESTTAKRISQIRSHVAKDSHARRRQRKAAAAAAYAGPSSVSAANSSYKEDIADIAATAASTDSSNCPLLLASADESYSTSATWPSANTALGRTGFRRIAPKDGAMVRSAASPGPRQMIGDSMRDAWNGQFAWELSFEDYNMFNYFLDWVLKYGYAVCFPPEQAGEMERRLKSVYVPFAMRNPGLLNLILYVAYHRRAMNTEDWDEAIRCNRKREHHRLLCIGWIRRAVSKERKPSIETIAMALILSSEAFFESNLVISLTHAQAARTMVTARGGLESFGDTGIDGLISFLLKTSVYCGNYFFVPGCSPPPVAFPLPAE